MDSFIHLDSYSMLQYMRSRTALIQPPGFMHHDWQIPGQYWTLLQHPWGDPPGLNKWACAQHEDMDLV